MAGNCHSKKKKKKKKETLDFWRETIVFLAAARAGVTLAPRPYVLQTVIHSFPIVLRFSLLGPMSTSFSYVLTGLNSFRRSQERTLGTRLP